MPTKYNAQALKVKGLGGPTSLPLTNLLHLTYQHPNTTPKYGPRSMIGGFNSLFVPYKDRIKWWNISPGDKVRMISGPKEFKKLHKLEVLEVDREQNYVYLKDGPVHTKRIQSENRDSSWQPTPKAVHYSNVQLYIGDFEFPPLPGDTENQLLPVYATRLNTTAPRWDFKLQRYTWRRFAAATAPRLPKRLNDKGNPIKLEIPWPVIQNKVIPECGPLDTPADEVLRVTWIPPSPSLNPGYHKKGEPTPQDLYLISPDPSQPVEHFLVNELSNPFSRAKRTRRWQMRPILRKQRLDRWIRREKRESEEYQDGRTMKEIKAEATFKFERWEEERRKSRNRVARDKSEKGKKILKKMHKRRVKKGKKKLRLRTVTLKPAPNQFIPPGMEAIELMSPLKAIAPPRATQRPRRTW